MQTILVIAIGGALGALARYETGLWIAQRWSHSFPLSTFLINISGAFLLGFLNVLFIENEHISFLWRAGIGIGFLGAFTTFSTFGFEVITLIERSEFLTAGAYTLLSVVVGFVGVALGVTLARVFFVTM